MTKLIKSLLASVCSLCCISPVMAEDIDLFASGLVNGAAASAVPNVIFVLDNTSNWSRQSQQWPDGKQGESEGQAIYDTLDELRVQGKNLNVALMEFTTGGTANQDGGYVRHKLQSVLSDWGELDATLTHIKENITTPVEKRNSNSAYGNLAYDIYAYLAGEAQSFEGEGTPGTASEQAYKTPFSLFQSPLTEEDICSDTYIILISNTDSNGPEVDTSDNSARLEALYNALGETPTAAFAGQLGDGIPMQKYETLRAKKKDRQIIGYSAHYYPNKTSCAENVGSNENEPELIRGSCSVRGECVCESVPKNAEGHTYKILSDQSIAGFGPVSDETVDGKNFNLDDWAKFLHEYGVPVLVEGVGDAPDSVARITVSTYTVDVFNARPNEEHSALMHSTAKQGGGYRQAASSQSELKLALRRIIGDIIDVNSSFAAVTLPLSATNRAQAENKVFVGMFRPAAQRKPRWLGNLKQYQLAVFDGKVGLADVSLNRAINPQTGFAQSCATSFWTRDTSSVTKDSSGTAGPYFEGLQLEPSPVSECLPEMRGVQSDDPTKTKSVLSDAPDGPFVEKGGVAQQIRRQPLRTIVTLDQASGSLRDVAVTDFEDDDVFDYLMGAEPGLKGGDLKVPDLSAGDINDPPYVDNSLLTELEVQPFAGRRATIHGDIVHSRPLTMTYGAREGGGSEFRVFYGSNDGLYRAINPENGQEDWAFIAPEHEASIRRLYANTPTVSYFGLEEQSSKIGAENKQYFFDGSTGSFTRYDARGQLEEGYIYLTQRRGGRMIYALDVSPGADAAPPAAPRFLWRVGCTTDSATSCTHEDFSGIGDTWSTPVTGFVRGYVGVGGSIERPNPILLVGGGSDACLDANSATLSLADCEKGKFIYALDGKTGAVLRAFPTVAPVVADIEIIDFDYDGYIDFAYAVDVTGRIYRITFSHILDGAIDHSTALTPEEWRWPEQPIALTQRANLRFMNQPIAAEVGNNVFIALGSGDRERPLKQNYPYQTEPNGVENRFYTFIDSPLTPGSTAVDLDSLMDAAVGSCDAPDQSGQIDNLLTCSGWYLDLPDRGEQVVNQAAIGGGYVFFNSFQAEGSSKGFCNDLGTAKAYRVPLFAPEAVEGKAFGEGIPIPPIIVTVRLSDAEETCEENCGPGRITDDVVSVIIGLEGFEVVDITPSPPSKVREAFRVENIDKL